MLYCNPSPLAKAVLSNSVVIKQLLCSSWEAAIPQQWETWLLCRQQGCAVLLSAAVSFCGSSRARWSWSGDSGQDPMGKFRCISGTSVTNTFLRACWQRECRAGPTAVPWPKADCLCMIKRHPHFMGGSHAPNWPCLFANQVWSMQGKTGKMRTWEQAFEIFRQFFFAWKRWYKMAFCPFCSHYKGKK